MMYRITAAHGAHWTDINATSYSVNDRGLITFHTGNPTEPGPVFIARNTFSIEPLHDT